MNNTAPIKEGFYWATSIRRQAKKGKPCDFGQVGGVRGIVRVLRLGNDEIMRVQAFGSERLKDSRDFKDWDGPLGDYHEIKLANREN